MLIQKTRAVCPVGETRGGCDAGTQGGNSPGPASLRPIVSASPNPWLPWTEPRPRGPAPPGGPVLAIIPTAARGQDRARLRRCVMSLRGASKGLGAAGLRVLVVVCPSAPGALARAAEAADGQAEVLALAGPFNWCRSLNEGARALRAGDGWVLVSNDDVEWTGSGDLARLRDTARAHDWAAVGPWVSGRLAWEDAGQRVDGVRRVNQPLVGTCCLVRRDWWDRVAAPYGQAWDEVFGLGWGLDESDWFLRALRLGATWGRDERVGVEHEFHGTFGDAATDQRGPLYQRNLAAFRAKYGPDVHVWGESQHWWPLPGILVAISGWNVEPWIGRCLKSVDEGLRGYRYVVLCGDDGSTDGTLRAMLEHESRADHYAVRSYGKALNAGEAKNRVLGMLGRWRKEYPAVFLMDADDVMPRARPGVLLWQARDRGLLLGHGGLKYVNPGGPDDGWVYGPTGEQQRDGSLSPCSLIVHESLVPADGRLFPEDMESHEDADLFVRWHLAGIESAPLFGPGGARTPVHEYHKRWGSVSFNERREELVAAWKERYRRLMAGEAV